MTLAMDEQKILPVGCGPYDRIAALVDGRVTMADYRLDMRIMPVTQIPPASFGRKELAVAEVALGQLAEKIEAGDLAYLGLPVFLSTAFRHDSVYVRKDGPVKTMADLGKARIGTTQYFGTTTIWIRGMLQQQYGVDFSDTSWTIGPLDKPAGDIRRHHAEGANCGYLSPGDSLTAKFERGELDALFCYQVPAAYRSGAAVMLIENLEAAEKAYHGMAGSVPLLHLLVLRAADRDGDPNLAAGLVDAFTKSKDIALKALADTACYNVSLPSLSQAVERARSTVGDDFWPCGMERNRTGVETFLRYCFEQGMTKRLLTVADMFPDFA